MLITQSVSEQMCFSPECVCICVPSEDIFCDQKIFVRIQYSLDILLIEIMFLT